MQIQYKENIEGPIKQVKSLHKEQPKLFNKSRNTRKGKIKEIRNVPTIPKTNKQKIRKKTKIKEHKDSKGKKMPTNRKPAKNLNSNSNRENKLKKERKIKNHTSAPTSNHKYTSPKTIGMNDKTRIKIKQSLTSIKEKTSHTRSETKKYKWTETTTLKVVTSPPKNKTLNSTSKKENKYSHKNKAPSNPRKRLGEKAAQAPKNKQQNTGQEAMNSQQGSTLTQKRTPLSEKGMAGAPLPNKETANAPLLNKETANTPPPNKDQTNTPQTRKEDGNAPPQSIEIRNDPSQSATQPPQRAAARDIPPPSNTTANTFQQTGGQHINPNAYRAGGSAIEGNSRANAYTINDNEENEEEEEQDNRQAVQFTDLLGGEIDLEDFWGSIMEKEQNARTWTLLIGELPNGVETEELLEAYGGLNPNPLLSRIIKVANKAQIVFHTEKEYKAATNIHPRYGKLTPPESYDPSAIMDEWYRLFISFLSKGNPILPRANLETAFKKIFKFCPVLINTNYTAKCTTCYVDKKNHWIDTNRNAKTPLSVQYSARQIDSLGAVPTEY